MSETTFETYFRNGVEYIKARDGTEYRMPSDEENARIHAAALSDPDAQPMTDEQLDRMRPAREVMSPKLYAALTRKDEDSAQIRLDEDLVSTFRATGRGWQARVNAALRMFLKEHPIPEPEVAVEAHP